MTWTCYNGRERACGKCGACVERLEAFSNNETVDPLPYEIPVQDAVPHEHGDCEQGHG
jgi:7-cyano-7-deazaguanine synthase in queuosine biosynthesis